MLWRDLEITVKLLGINNVDSKPEPNVQKKCFPSFIHSLGELFKNDVFLEKHFTELILVAQSSASPTTACACRTDQNSWRN